VTQARRLPESPPTSPPAERLELKVWLRLLACASQGEAPWRRELQGRFGTTMPTFDILAQIDRRPRGPTMSELSKRLMASKGNITDLVGRLEARGLVERRTDPADGRRQHIYLTPAGEQLFSELAPAHHDYVVELMRGMDATLLQELYDGLGRLKAAIAAAERRRQKRQRATDNDGTSGAGNDEN
jgi:DNA-binding MarR family transcriptional regulator